MLKYLRIKIYFKLLEMFMFYSKLQENWQIRRIYFTHSNRFIGVREFNQILYMTINKSLYYR